jgi:hypothetical protein
MISAIMAAGYVKQCTFDTHNLGINPGINPGLEANLCFTLDAQRSFKTRAMIRENQQLVTNEPVEFEKSLVEVQDCRKITDHFRGIYKIYPNLINENRRMSTCNRLDLKTLGSQPIMYKNLPGHWTRGPGDCDCEPPPPPHLTLPNNQRLS